MNSVLFSIGFVFLATLYQVETQFDEDEKSSVELESQFYCNKLTSCTNGGPKVCGYDQYKPWLAEFEDMCLLYKANCKYMGRFRPVEKVVCDTRIKYDKEHPNETFEARYRELYSAYSCYKKLGCYPGGGWVCGRDAILGMARFHDLCQLLGVNCLGHGAYVQVSTAICKPKIRYVETLTAYYGQPITRYLTEPLNITTRKPKLRRQKPSQFTKIKDAIGISANFSIHF